MRINSYFGALDGSAHYRLVEPYRAMAAQGVDVTLVPLGTFARDCDVVVFNRPQSKEYAETVVKLADEGYGVIVDMDDDFDSLRSNHAMAGRVTTKWLHEACKAATLVTCTTPALAERYGYDHAMVIPNYVPAWHFDWEVPVDKAHEGIWIGWSGTVGSHPNDLQQTRGALTKVNAQTGAKFAYVGPKHEMPLVRDALKYKGPGLTAGWFVIEDFPKAISEFDVGIVPLEANTFNQSKSWLKGLELASVGVPFVASPTPDYKRLAGFGIGLLAQYRNDWIRQLTALSASAQFASEQGAQMREKARELSLPNNTYRWVEAFEQANAKRGAGKRHLTVVH